MASRWWGAGASHRDRPGPARGPTRYPQMLSPGCAQHGASRPNPVDSQRFSGDERPAKKILKEVCENPLRTPPRGSTNCPTSSPRAGPEGATRRDLPEARRPNGERRTTPRTGPQGTGRGAEGDNSAGRTDREVAATAGASGQPEDPDGRTVEALPDRTGQPATIEDQWPKARPRELILRGAFVLLVPGIRVPRRLPYRPQARRGFALESPSDRSLAPPPVRGAQRAALAPGRAWWSRSSSCTSGRAGSPSARSACCSAATAWWPCCSSCPPAAWPT